MIRDQRLLFTAHLGTSRHPAHRQAAFVLLQSLRTYEVARLLRYLKEHVRSVPRPVKRAVEHWLRRRERNEAWFDEVALRDRRNLKTLYASLHIRPSPRAGKILFDRRYPEDSRLTVVQRLARIQSPRQKARLIVRHRIFASTGLGAVGALTPPVLAAVIDVMTPQQLANSLAALKRRGAFNHRGCAHGGDLKLISLCQAPIATEAVSEIEERRLPAADDLLEGIDVYSQHTSDIQRPQLGIC